MLVRDYLWGLGKEGAYETRALAKLHWKRINTFGLRVGSIKKMN